MTASIPYSPGHPWYYHLGGRVLFPKDICEAVEASGYRGWRERILDEIDQKAEPVRSAELRQLRNTVHIELRANLSRYRECARLLSGYRRRGGKSNNLPVCANIHSALSLKHNHLYNDFAHLLVIEELLGKQPDLFESL